MYTLDDEFGWKQSCAFRNAFSITVHVDFLGVWCIRFIAIPELRPILISFIPRDTVNSVGMFPRRLPFTMANSGIRVYRHAVSLDEHRAKFMANLSPHTGGAEDCIQIKERRLEEPKKKPTLRELEKRWSDPRAPTDVLEVWFSGE
jgi:hypothetical protein